MIRFSSKNVDFFAYCFSLAPEARVTNPFWYHCWVNVPMPGFSQCKGVAAILWNVTNINIKN